MPTGTIFNESLKTLPTVMSTIATGGISRSGGGNGGYGYYDDTADFGIPHIPKQR